MNDMQIDLVFKDGFEKHLTILYKPFGGNKLFYYDESLRIILDCDHLYRAERIYFTNAERSLNQGLTNVITKFDQNVTIEGVPSLTSTLKLYYTSGNYYYFDSEISLCIFSGNYNHKIGKCTAKIN